MSKTTSPEEHKQISDRLALVRTQLRETGATAITPTPEWAALRKEMMVLVRKLK